MIAQPQLTVIKLSQAGARPEPYGTYKIESKYENGDIGYVVIPGTTMVKIKQALKQLLVLGIDGAQIKAEFPGMRFHTYPRVKITTYHSRTHNPDRQANVGSVELLLWQQGVEVVLTSEDAMEACHWDVTDQFQAFREETANRFNVEREKRKVWLTKYKEGGKRPVMRLKGAKRGRKRKTHVADN